jgi:hypothetical protein
LETAFGYARADADLLAVFTKYYNAVYRGKIDELGARYSAAVMGNISAENAGIALSYREWPGRTRLLVPFARAGIAGEQPAAAVSTTELTVKKVIEQLQTEPDKGLPDRKAMVDLKEREVEKAKEAIAAEEKKIADQKVEVAKLEEAAKASTPAPTPASAPSEPPAAAPGLSPETKAAALPTAPQPQAAPTPQASAVAEAKATIAQAEKQVAAQKEAVAAKVTEIAKDRQSIVTDEKATPAPAQPATSVAAAVSESLLYLTGRGSPEGGRLVVIDPVTRATTVSSAAGGLTGLDYSYFKESIVVLAREGQAVHLLLLEPKNLSVTARGTDGMYAGSYVHSQAGAVYAITLQGETARLGKYDETLTRTALSTEVVDKDTYVRIFGDEVYVSAPDGSVMVLAAADLSRKALVRGGSR